MLVLLLGRWFSMLAAFALIIAACVFKAYTTGFWQTYAPFAQLDFLGGGALLALVARHVHIGRIELVLRCLLPLALPFVLVLSADLAPYVIHYGWSILGRLVREASPLGIVLVSCWLIARAVAAGPEGSSWGGQALPWLGRISYGIYVYHLPVRYLVDLLDPNWHWYWRLSGAVASIAIAWASYRFLEAPLVGLGRRLAARIGHDPARQFAVAARRG